MAAASAATAAVPCAAAPVASAAESFIFNDDFNAVSNDVPMVPKCCFNAAWNVVFHAVSLLFRADFNAVMQVFTNFVYS